MPPHVKTSLAPGSRVVTDYFDKAGLDRAPRQARLPHRRLRLHDVHRQQRPAARADRQGRERRQPRGRRRALGNRNFEGRINPLVKANYLASPPLVVAYALAGTTDIDFDDRADRRRQQWVTPVYPQATSGRRTPKCKTSSTNRVLPEMFRDAVRRRVGTRNQVERDQDQRRRALRWDPDEHVHPGAAVPRGLMTAKPARSRPIPRRPLPAALRRLGHDRPHLAGRLDRQDEPRRQVPDRARRRAADFNSYGARRGNDRVMTPRHVRQHPHPQPARPRHRRRRHEVSRPTPTSPKRKRG